MLEHRVPEGAGHCLHASHVLGTALGAGGKPEGELSSRLLNRGTWECWFGLTTLWGRDRPGEDCQEDQEEMREGQEKMLGLALKDAEDFKGEKWGGGSNYGSGCREGQPWSSPDWAPGDLLHVVSLVCPPLTPPPGTELLRAEGGCFIRAPAQWGRNPFSD